MAEDHQFPSRCSTPGTDYVWHRLRQSDEPVDIVDVELARAITGSTKSAEERLHFYSDLKALLDAAQRGELADDVDAHGTPVLKAIWKHPYMWEIRCLGPSGQLLRQYHVEPPEEPFLLLSVKAHLKDVSSNNAGVIKDAQNAEIREGIRRFEAERSNKWGLP